ncbi:DUF916 and DUF3324 domain-containing protein [Bhargavaea massiliensis]|uniref:DUF916 and DUF3324 domain-containing protein n=1 Tax=Bhargavaea massiliensis TaxID=2697500 RepID=UPI001BCAFD01|nr:DUF916 and DUF3324 domain-containing protein [Bhargavaea massiliensis]
MQVKVRFMIALLLLVSNIFLLSGIAAADDHPVGFSVSAVLPDNQVNPSASYFDLRVEPGAEQELRVEIYNHEQEELTVRLGVYNASTNSNGIIVYEEGEIDPSLTEPITDLLSFKEEEVTIPAAGTKTVAATLKVPEKPFEGIRLGGMHFEKVLDEEGPAEGVQIENRYAYVIGVQLSESGKPVKPELVFGEVKPDLVNHRTAVTAKLRNTAPVLISGLSLHAKVLDGDGELVQEKEQADIRMAPNSSMDFIIDWNNRPLDPGTYEVAMTAELEDEKWEWTEKFEIERDQARDINKEAVELVEAEKPVWMSVGIGTLAVIVVVLLLYIRRLKAQVDSDDKKGS